MALLWLSVACVLLGPAIVLGLGRAVGWALRGGDTVPRFPPSNSPSISGEQRPVAPPARYL